MQEPSPSQGETKTRRGRRVGRSVGRTNRRRDATPGRGLAALADCALPSPPQNEPAAASPRSVGRPSPTILTGRPAGRGRRGGSIESSGARRGVTATRSPNLRPTDHRQLRLTRAVRRINVARQPPHQDLAAQSRVQYNAIELTVELVVACPYRISCEYEALRHCTSLMFKNIRNLTRISSRISM